jgi:hypothetical protein
VSRLFHAFSAHALLIALILTIQGSSYARGFLPAVNYPTGAEPFTVAIADFNGDGKPDLAAANYVDGTISILLGRGDGTFVPTKTHSICLRPIRIVAGDLNGDGRPDLVATCQTGSAKDIAVMLNSASGFLPSQFFNDGGTGAGPLVLADFDGDGILDLVVGDGPMVSFLKGNGDGSFQLPETSFPGFNIQWLVAADFNHDGHLDVAAADGNVGAVVLLGNGDGTFQSAMYLADNLDPVSVAAGDFNQDGHLDLVLANESKTVTVFLGNGDGTFQSPTTLEVGKGPRSVAVGDFNGDGALDIAVAIAEAGVAVMYGRGDGTFPLLRRFRTDGFSSNQSFVVAVDLNHDRALDMAVVNHFKSTISILMNSGGTFVTTTSSQNPAPVGQSVTFTAAIAPSLVSTIPTGTVTFADGATILATVPLDPSGQASFTTSSLSLGTHTIRTKYSGDPDFNPNTGKAITQIIQ